MNKVVAGVVLFNPILDEILKSIDKLAQQFDKIILFDNTESIKDCKLNSQILNNKKIIYLSENKNLGIAYALNKIMETAQHLDYEWVVTFDQDSKIPINIVSEYSQYFSDPKVGILCPQVIDQRRKYMKLTDSTNKFDKVNKCITSASCTRVDAWIKAGKYDELLFIDLVDNDFSKRVKIVGFDIYKINAVILEQEYGVIEYKDTKFSQFLLWLAEKVNNSNIAKLSYKKTVNPLRIYYTNRNVIYLNKKHKKYGGIGYESYYCQSFLEYYLTFNLASILRGQNKVKICKAVINGTIDGIRLAHINTPYSL